MEYYAAGKIMMWLHVFVIWKYLHPEKAGASLGKRGKARTVELDAVATSQL